MKLSTTNLLDTLNDCYNFTKCKKTSDIFCMERPVFYLSGMKIERCKIYILYEDLPDFPETPCPPDCLLLGFEGQPGIEKLPSDCLCVFSADLSAFVLFQQIQELFNRCDAWEEIRPHRVPDHPGGERAVTEKLGCRVSEASWNLCGVRPAP